MMISETDPFISIQLMPGLIVGSMNILGSIHPALKKSGMVYF